MQELQVPLGLSYNQCGRYIQGRDVQWALYIIVIIAILCALFFLSESYWREVEVVLNIITILLWAFWLSNSQKVSDLLVYYVESIFDFGPECVEVKNAQSWHMQASTSQLFHNNMTVLLM